MRTLWLTLALVAAAPTPTAALDSDPARGHYLLAPSAFLLRGGEAVFSQTEGFLSQATVGIGDHLDVSIGSAVPALTVAGTGVFNLTVALKLGTSLSDRLHVAAGFQTLSFPGVTAGYGYAVATLGDERLNVSVGAGLPMVAMRDSASVGGAIVFVGGVLGLGRHLALATENWLVPSLAQLPMINAGIVRVDVWRLSIGLGAVRMDPIRFLVPWLDLSVRVFG